MRKHLKIFVLLLSAILPGFGCTACGSQTEEADNHITVSLYDITLLGKYSEYVESQVPDADIEWSVGKNSLSFYTYLQKHNDLPDLITSRRFSVLDAQELKDSLLDLSETELASSYHSVYLDKYRNDDDTVNWLPAPGIFDNLIANKKLFDEYEIPLPTDYESFISACQEFESKGIRGFISDYQYDYTNMEILQGLSMESLSSLEGRTWRRDYENKTVSGLDDAVWPSAFERVQDLLDKNIIRPEDAMLDYYDVHEAFINDEAAMIRGTGGIVSDAVKCDKMDVTALPYLSSSEEENWALTYPVFQTAVTRITEENEKHKQLALKVLDAMYSSEAQLILNDTIGAQISYNKDIHLPLSEEMSEMESLIQKNHIYIRVASNDFFQVSKDVISCMMSGEYDAEQAYEAFDKSLGKKDPVTEKAAVTIDTGYSCQWDSEKGNEAASSIANTVCEALEADVLVMPFYNANCGIYAGEHTEAELGYPVQGHSLVIGEVTGEDLTVFLSQLTKEADAAYQLPVVSGVTMQVRESDDGFSLESLQVQGRDISPEDTFSFVYSNKSGPKMEKDLQCFSGSGEMTPLEMQSMQTVWTEYLMSGNTPAKPDEYIVISK